MLEIVPLPFLTTLAPERNRKSLSRPDKKKIAQGHSGYTPGSEVQTPAALLPAPSLNQVMAGRSPGVRRHAQSFTYEDVSSEHFPASEGRQLLQRNLGTSVQVEKDSWPSHVSPKC